MTKPKIKFDPRVSIGASWQHFLSVIAEHDGERLVPGGLPFVDYAWREFKPKAVISVLMSEQPTYKALRPILFSGLCTWAICPKKESLRRHGMLLVGIEHLREAEIKGRSAFDGHGIPNHDLLGDIMGRLRMLGQDFYTDFYYPIGGLSQVLRSPTPSIFTRSIAKHSEDIMIAIGLMQIFDFHAKYLSDGGRWYIASESKVFELVRDIFSIGRASIPRGFDKLNEVWRAQLPSIAFSYAASTVEVGGEHTLLDVIRSGKVEYEAHRCFIETWMRRSRYVSDTILSNTTKPDTGKASALILTGLEAEPTPIPQFESFERSRIEAEFDRDAILQNRGRDKPRVRLSRRGPRTGK